MAAGLELWLHLSQEGYMDTGLGMYDGAVVRRLFEQELAKGSGTQGNS